MARKLILVSILVVFGAFGVFAGGEGKVMDGFKSVTVAGVNVQWMVDGDSLRMQLKAMTTGWVAVGFEPSRQMKDADIIIGYVSGGEVFIRDDTGTANTRHGPVVDNGGTNDLSEIGGSEVDGVTTLSFVIPLDSGDALDKKLEPGKTDKLIAAQGPDGKDDFGTYHGERGSTEIEL